MITHQITSKPNNYVWFGETYKTDVYDLNAYTDYNYWDFGMNFESYEECENFIYDNNLYEPSNQNFDEPQYPTECYKKHQAGDKVLWRIIGVMNNIKSSTSETTGSSRIKLIREDSIGAWSWDSSASSVNNGLGVNEWSQSDIKTVLNDYYYNNRANQTCCISSKNESVPCDFSKIGLESRLKSLISTAVWNTGSTGTETNPTKSKMYQLERGNTTGKTCTSGTTCNDSVTRTTEWTGNIGLMYPSDFGYSYNTLSNKSMSSWSTSSWLTVNSTQWTMTPGPNAYQIYKQLLTKRISSHQASDGINRSSWITSAYTRPVVYLKPNVKITGNGTAASPYTMSLD